MTYVADRSLRCFATLGEVDDFVTGLDGAMRIAIGRGGPPSSLGPSVRIPADATAVLVGFPDVSDGRPIGIVENPGQHAWARLMLPITDRGALTMATLDIRTSWLTHDNPKGLTVFDRVATQLRPQLQRPTWAWSVSTPHRAEVDRNVGFTEGAADLFDRGAAWMQEGVPNVRYGPSAPT